MFGVTRLLRQSSENTLYSGRYVISVPTVRVHAFQILNELLPFCRLTWIFSVTWKSFAFSRHGPTLCVEIYIKKLTKFKGTEYKIGNCIFFYDRYIMIAKRVKGTSSSISWISFPIFPSSILALVSIVHTCNVWSHFSFFIYVKFFFNMCSERCEL